MKTLKNCTCKLQWRAGDLQCASDANRGCCNPDQDPGGSWCVTTEPCDGQSFDHCNDTTVTLDAAVDSTENQTVTKKLEWQWGSDTCLTSITTPPPPDYCSFCEARTGCALLSNSGAVECETTLSQQKCTELTAETGKNSVWCSVETTEEAVGSESASYTNIIVGVIVGLVVIAICVGAYFKLMQRKQEIQSEGTSL